jgi:DNA-binding NtrC family response regulator
MHTTPPPTATQPALRVWLVEDDASIRWVLERALRASGMVPRAFDSAEPALAALRTDVPDVLLTDIACLAARASIFYVRYAGRIRRCRSLS